jgi:hypothetical protein
VYITVFHRLSQSTKPDVRIFLTFLQFCFLFMGTEASAFIAWLSIFDFNVFQAGGSRCIAPLDSMQRLLSGVYLPLAAFAVHFVNWLLNFLFYRVRLYGHCRCTYYLFYCCDTTPHPAPNNTNPINAKDNEVASSSCWNFSEARFSHGPWVRTCIGLLLFSYNSIVSTIFKFFACVQVGNTSYVSAYPSIECGGAEHTEFSPLIYTLMVAIMFGIPFGLVVVLLYGRHKKLLPKDEKFRQRYGILFEVCFFLQSCSLDSSNVFLF